VLASTPARARDSAGLISARAAVGDVSNAQTRMVQDGTHHVLLTHTNNCLDVLELVEIGCCGVLVDC
jgi:hypothetical protein